MRKLFTLLLTLCVFYSAKSQSIAVTAPNGGEVLYACQTYLITWNATGTSNFYDIDYSLNGGGTWASIASNINVTNGQYTWTVPNAESATCLVRVRDKNDVLKTDVSNAVFTIHIPVVVTSPNGGESWVGNSSHLITWNIQGTSLSFNLDYSINGGSTWNPIAINVSTSVGTYNWTVPNIPSTSCMVRVRDALTNCMQDVSDNNFTITPAQPVLTYPNGGESSNWGQSVNITWVAATFYSAVRLEYSIDGGNVYTLITSSTSNSGNFTWTIPSNVNSTQCLIKASNVSNVSFNDMSNANFSIIAPKITITSPNGGESWLGCDPHAVTATATNLPAGLNSSYFSFYYSIDNGVTWLTLTTLAGSGSSYNYSWTLPNTVSTTQALVRVANDLFPIMSDTSNAVFSIQPNNVITVTAPNGGEVFTGLSSTVITWTNSAGASGLYNVQFSATGPTSGFVTLASGISGNSYSWNNIPNIPGSNYYVRVQDAGNVCKNDVSNAAFTVSAAQPILNYPNGGESFNWGQSVNILWNANTFYSPVRLEYSIDNGTTWVVIVTNTANSGSYSWTVPSNVNSAQCLVKASNVSNVLINDISNATFSILQPKITITSPNGGESWLGCDLHALTATATNLPAGLSSSNFSFYYSIDNGATWVILTSIPGSGSNYSYNWTLPNTITTSQALVRVFNDAFSTMSDTSNAVFSIQPNNVITVTAPNGGEIFPSAGSTVITWTNTAGASGLYNIQASSSGPTSGFVTIASGVSGNSYNWTNIFNTPSTNYYVRVQDAGNICKADVSNAAFTVTAQTPLLAYPNGGETFNWNQAINITWIANTFYNNIRLEYSIDNGVTWNLISANTSNTGSYSWTVPAGVNSTQCLVKASTFNNISINDVSNATFSILQPKIVITSPNGGESWLGCNAYSVTATASNLPASAYSSSSFNYYYSIDNGATWSIFGSVSPTSSQTAINTSWTVPNGVSSAQVLVRVANDFYPTMSDTSNAVFAIQPNNVITVTAPNGGEVFTGLSSTVITWTNTAGASGLYNVQFSATGPTSGFVTLASGISGNSYSWNNIPNIPGNNYYVRVQDAGNVCKNDVSNAAFTVTAAQPTLYYPNGGESFNWGQSVNVTWAASTFYSSIRLEYSINNGVTWQLINSNTPNSGSYSWTVPSNVNSAQCLVKASNVSNVSINDISNATFSILQPKVTITSPNGGETWLGCDPHAVTAIAANLPSGYTSSSFTFYYSIDNGSNWIPIGQVANPSGASINYSWILPNTITSTEAMVRVTNDLFPTMSDTSNAVFSIQPNTVITVTAPNGGEIFPATGSTVITWTNTAGASGLYNIQASFSGPTSGFVTIASGVSGNSYNWNSIFNTPSSNYYVRVQDAGNTCKADVSNAPFTVTAQMPLLTYPNGGETFNWNQVVNVTWNPNTFYTNIRLEYSIDNGVTWNLITSNTSNTGNYSWTVPGVVNSTQCLVKASSFSNVSVNDISNATFSILAPKITITAPNGGESWTGCDTRAITATALNIPAGLNSSFFTFFYSIDNGTNWLFLGSLSGSGTSYSYNWIVPNISTTQALVRVANDLFPGMADTSNAVFSIQPNSAITVTAPNGGEVFPALTSTVITWTNTASASGLYNVQFSATGPTSGFVTLASGISGNSFTWNNIPNLTGGNYYVRVQDAGNTCKNDVSNGTFTITAAQPVLISPNGGEQLWSGSTYNISWTAATFYSTVRLEYSLDNGATWTVITTSTSNTGSYSWTIPAFSTIYSNCLVKASNSSNVYSNDVSNAVFTIKPAVKISTPNGFDQLGACTQTSINFEHSPAYTGFNIEYSLNHGTTWSTLVSNGTYSGTTGSYTWSIPNAPSTKALVRVYPSNFIALADASDTDFTIKPSVTVILPSYGGVLQSGTTYQIKWGSDGISNLYDIAYSTSGSTGTFTNIVTAYNTATNTYNWTVPNAPSENCYIRVRDNVSACKQDISDFAFAIRTTPAPITITNPGVAETLNGCRNYNITWTESGTPVGTYNIEFSPDNGATWSSIVSNYATTAGAYNWIVPNIQTVSGLIRISSSSVSTITDIADFPLIIIAGTVTAKPDTTICAGTTINLLATGGLDTYTWSPSTYLSSTTIANPTATPIASIKYIVTSSNGSCVIRDTASIVVQQIPSFNITADATNVCGGQVVTFTAHVLNGAGTPIFQWKRNNVNLGPNDSIFVISSLGNGDNISCVLSYNTTCFGPITSNIIPMIVNPKPNLGNDTSVSVTCAGCTVNLNSFYNTTGYLYVSWNTPNPAAAAPGIYRLVVSQLNGCTCPDSDTAFVYVNNFNSLTANTCAGGTAAFTSDVSGSSYQWQVNTGSGFVNLPVDAQYGGSQSNQLSLSSVPSSTYGYQYRCLVNGSSFSNIFTLKIANYWTGTYNTDWENPGNWGCGQVPDRNTDVYIYSGKPNYPDVTCNRACRSVFAGPETSLQVLNNKLLYLTGKQ